MSASDHLGVYAEGWTNGDSNTILRALSDDYVLDDPNTGKITKGDFANYMAELEKSISSLRGGKSQSPFMELSDVVTKEEGDCLTAWCSWSIPGTEMRGSGLIEVGPDGVHSERLTYYTKLGS